MKVFFNKWLLSFLALCIIIIGLAAISPKSKGELNQDTVAIVNGEAISKSQLYDEMYKVDGMKSLDTLINQKLIQQEAKKLNIQVTDTDVQAELQKIKDNLGNNYNQALVSNNMTENELKQQLALNVLMKKAVSNKVTVSDQEINDYLSTQKDSSIKDKGKVKELLYNQKLSTEEMKWLSDIRSKANIKTAMDSKNE